VVLIAGSVQTGAQHG